MAFDRFIIGPTGGLQTNLKPWLIPDEAMAQMDNCYVFRGRVRKRFGSRWMGDNSLLSRLRMSLTPAVLTVTTPINIAVGQQFSIGADVFTVNDITPPYPVNLLSTSAVTAQLVAANQVTFSAIASTVYWYPALPVMGLMNPETSAINNEPTYAFDTRFAYQYVNGWTRLDGEATPGASMWTGDNSQFFWGTTWSGANAADRVLFVTNFNETEPNFMRYFFGGQWNNFEPAIDGSNFLISARILVVFKNRLVALNTWEGPNIAGAINYTNRARYSQIGSPLATDAWKSSIPGKGNAIDASTMEDIITVEFLKDRLIVYFERSTWELAYTGNQAYPFTWQKINTELGAESTFSIVPFDKIALGVGNVGIHACNGSNVERIDVNIPDTVFAIHNENSGVERVCGIRDYFVEMVYWTFPSADRSADFPYPNRVLVYNYKTGSWAFNDDSFTIFGYFWPQTGITWDSDTVTWDDDVSWNEGAAQSLFRQVIAGNQEGYVLIVDTDEPTNALALQITDIINNAGNVQLLVIDHNFEEEDFIYIDGITGLTGSFTGIYQVTDVVDKNNFTIIAPAILARLVAGDKYSGGGEIARVSRIDMLTKQFNFYVKDGRNAYIQKGEFQVDRTDNGRITVDFFVSSGTDSQVQAGTLSGSIMGTNILETSPYALYPFEQQQDRLWHTIYFQGDGEFVQFRLYLNDAQMTDVNIMESQFQLHAMIFYAMPTSDRLQ